MQLRSTGDRFDPELATGSGGTIALDPELAVQVWEHRDLVLAVDVRQGFRIEEVGRAADIKFM